VWIKHAVDHLRPDGRLVMMLPLSELAPVAAARRRPDLKLRAYLSSLFGGATSGSLRLDGVVVMPRGLRTDITGPVALLAMSGPEREPHPGEVPVAWIGSRTSVDSVVDVLDDAMRTHGARALLEVQLPDIQIPDVIVRRIHPGHLWETLEQLVEVAGRESNDARRSSPRRVLSDEMEYEFVDDTDDRAEAVQRLAGRVSDNSVQALLSDSLTARRALRATASRAEVLRSERPRDVFAFDAIDRVVAPDDVLPEQADYSFVDVVDTTGVGRAVAELSRLLADARRGAVAVDAAAQRRLAEVTSMLEAAIDALERGRSKR
jgi:hypothetical protein